MIQNLKSRIQNQLIYCRNSTPPLADQSE